MGRRTTGASDRGAPGEGGGTASPTARQAHRSAPPAPEALLAFAEELGRLVACQLFADADRRRGYGLPQALPDLAFNAVVPVIAYDVMVWLRH